MRRALIAGSAIACFLSTANAQEPAPQANSDGVALGEVVVTAQRREENLQRAAIAVSAVPGDVLIEQSISQATDVTRLVPALQIAQGAALTQIYLRGVGTFGANAFAEQGVAFNLDGVYLSRPAAPTGLFYDLERLEVLKGPQGTLYGRNATGGAINAITAKPRLGVNSGYFTGEFGNYNAFKASGAVNIPLGENTAVRIAGQHAKHDGYFSDGYDDEDSNAIRAQLRSAIGPNVDVTFMVDYAHATPQGSGGTIMPLLFGDDDQRLGPSDPAVIAAYTARPPTPPVPQIIAKSDGYNDNEFLGYTGTVDADLGFARLTVIPAYRETNLDYLSYASSFKIDVVEESQQTSLEARLANETDALKWVLGAYAFDESIKANQRYDQASNGTSIISNLGTKSYAVFGQATYSLSDAFRLTAGVRYTEDQKDQNTDAQTLPFVGFVPPGPPNFIPIIAVINTKAISDVTFARTTWKAGVEYDLGPSSLLYASAATGFKSGVLFAAQTQNYSDPEILTAYTIGSKNRFVDNRLQLNVEAFYWDYKDQQISHLGPVQVASTPGGPIFGPVFMTENAGAATIWGVETELQFLATANDLFSANIQYLNSEYDELRYQAYSTTGAPPVIGCPITPTTQIGASAAARIFNVDCSGQSLVNAPNWAVNLGYEHTFDLADTGRLILGVDTRIESSRYLSIDYLALGRQDGSMVSNARLTYETQTGNFALTGFVNNIEDELVFANSLQSPAKAGVIYNQLRPPRTYGVRLTAKY